MLNRHSYRTHKNIMEILSLFRDVELVSWKDVQAQIMCEPLPLRSRIVKAEREGYIERQTESSGRNLLLVSITITRRGKWYRDGLTSGDHVEQSVRKEKMPCGLVTSRCFMASKCYLRDRCSAAHID